jgi:hypothetical protein
MTISTVNAGFQSGAAFFPNGLIKKQSQFKRKLHAIVLQVVERDGK